MNTKTFKKLDNYTITRLKLAGFYFLILLGIVSIFSFMLLRFQFSQLERFKDVRLPPNTQFRSQIDKLLEEERRQEIERVVAEVQKDSIINVIVFDIAILAFAGFLSNYLAGKTLKKIFDSLEAQKRFVSDASHELRTPLTSIKTEGEVLIRSKNSTFEEYQDFSKSVLEEVDNLNLLITRLLDIAKSDNDSQIISLENIDISELTNKVIDKFELICKEKNVEITRDIQESIFANTDKIRFQELLNIFIDNAIKYNRDDGLVTVKLSGPEPIIEINDSGIGIPKEDLDKIFDRFYRVSKDRNKKGFGLGLSIADQIAKELGITLSIESIVEKGTKITLKFPKQTI